MGGKAGAEARSLEVGARGEGEGRGEGTDADGKRKASRSRRRPCVSLHHAAVAFASFCRSPSPPLPPPVTDGVISRRGVHKPLKKAR